MFLRQGLGNTEISGTSYDAKQLYKTQPDSHANRSTIEGRKESIKTKGPNVVDPIPVRVHNGQALIMDRHPRYKAFVELGYERIPIKYIHENQIINYGRTIQNLLNNMFKNVKKNMTFTILQKKFTLYFKP
ncbi:hypothetical protein M2475_000797 [Breznakia sp. PF5-3]|uniref:ParB N-terminal domain-containing protein n=1 Tax=unclassified Breznakia TaxID=2623764 RepID=UPI002406AE35|nr:MULTISPECIES: ParB N-terminal domain-containing protein [unclassified Breznakia]MDF9824485.1 hypothetical protein [Breznakia sp. PM6-1]MDF9835232.1 hypothetical protein [Breznakia sp. PF5-3]MDF9837440.1 hypothetical protein [Breznakia sp. PFB2-8]MDF9859376.1 hypothetical protein [Breznakia sp. PH5-24]